MSEIHFGKFQNASPKNFALADARKEMEEALKRVRGTFGTHYRLHDGAPSQQRTANVITRENPCKTSEVLGSVDCAGKIYAERALALMAEGSKSWRKTTPLQRATLLEKLADWFESRRMDLAALMVFEVGKNWKEADADVCEAIDFCRFYAREMLRLGTPHLTQDIPGEKNHLTYVPRGVAVVIAPWNFPLAILTGMTTAALVTGNTTIIKPAETSILIAAQLAQGLAAVGFPKDAFYFLPGVGSEIGPLLVGDERTDLIAFTGSAEVGLSILENAAKKPGAHQRGPKRVICEMGGKNAIIVDEDADIDEAVVGCLQAAFGFQGQKCSALSRLLVNENVYESFTHRFVEALKSLRVGPAWNPEYQIGPVIDDEAQTRIARVITEAKKRLKTLFCYGEVPQDGYYVTPAVFEVTSTDDFIFQNEIFGPVVAVKKVKDLDEAIRDANSTRFALTGGIYSRSPKSIERVVRDMEVGNLYINRPITGAIVERQPFGGFKMSGIGSKAGGPDYLLQFLDPRTITENTVRRGFAGD